MHLYTYKGNGMINIRPWVWCSHRKCLLMDTCYEVHEHFAKQDLLARTGPTAPPLDLTREILISGCPGAHSPVHLLRSPNQQMLAHWLCSRYFDLCELMRQGPFLPPSTGPPTPGWSHPCQAIEVHAAEQSVFGQFRM